MITTIEHQTQALENILLELQLSASRITDDSFKKIGAKNLMIAIQDTKQLLDMTKNLSIYQEISQYADSLEDYSGSLGIHNIV